MAGSRAVPLVVLASLTVLSTPALAAPRTYGLTVASVDPSCADVRALSAAIRAVGADEMSTEPGAPKFAVVFGRDEAGFTAVVSSPDGGVRELRAPACSELLSAVAAVVVLALDPIAERPGAEAAPALEPTAPPRPPATPAETEDSIRFAVVLRAWAMSGFGPVSPGVIADYEVVPTPWLTVGLGGGVLNPRSASVGGGTITRGLVAGHIESCIYPYRRTLLIAGCYELVLGVRTFEPEGYDDARISKYPLFAPAASGRAVLPLGAGLALDGEVGVLLALPMYTYSVDHGNIVDRSDLVSVSARLGLRYTLP